MSDSLQPPAEVRTCWTSSDRWRKTPSVASTASAYPVRSGILAAVRTSPATADCGEGIAFLGHNAVNQNIPGLTGDLVALLQLVADVDDVQHRIFSSPRLHPPGPVSSTARAFTVRSASVKSSFMFQAKAHP